jgi:hypothetical protein
LEDPWLQEHVWNDRPHIDGRLIPVMDRAGRQRRNEETEAEDKKIVWRNDAIQVLRPDIMKEPTLVAGSVGSIATGFHYDEVVFDDIVTFDNSDTPEKRDRLSSWIQDIESVLDPVWRDEWLEKILKNVGVPDTHARKISQTGGEIDVLGTRYDKDDYYGMILERQEDLGFEAYIKNIYKNGKDDRDGYLWTNRMSRNYEEQLRQSMSARRFGSQYLNTILAPEEQVLSSDRIQYLHPANIRIKSGGIVEITRGDKEILIRPVLVIDPAASINRRADFTCIGVGGCDEDKNLYVLDLKMGRWKTDEWIKEMYSLADKWKLNAIHIETVGFQASLVFTIRTFFAQYRPIAIRDYRPSQMIYGRERRDNIATNKKERIEAILQPVFSNSMVFMQNYLGSDTELKDQINFFPRSTSHDDALDVLCMMVELGRPPIKTKIENKVLYFRNKKYGGLR